MRPGPKMVEVILLDGGMGQELVKRSGDRPTPQWSTQVMVDHPGLVAEVHRDFAAAGATLATSNTYAIHHDRLIGTPLEGKQAALVERALNELADGVGQHGRTAGAIGPLNGSYRPDAHPDHDTAVALYGELAGLLAPSVDILLGETIASVRHARALFDAVQGFGKPVWLAVTLDDDDGTLLRSGEPVSALSGLQPDAWLANCSVPEAMAAGLDVLRSFGKPFGAYANGFTGITKAFRQARSTVASLTARDDVGPEAYAEYALAWVGQGATIIGGCCEIGPAHIAEVASRLQAEGHKIA